MKFMIMAKASKDSEAGVMPTEKLLADMGKFNEALVKAGVMLAGEGLQPSAMHRRLVVAGLLCLSFPLAYAQGSLRAMGVDAECEQQVMAGTTACAQDAQAEMRACFTKRLTPRCAAQANAPPGATRDAACQQEIRAVVEPCGKALIEPQGRCVQARLSPQCNAQWAAANQKAQQIQARCQAHTTRLSEQLRQCLKVTAEKDQMSCVEAIKKEKNECDR